MLNNADIRKKARIRIHIRRATIAIHIILCLVTIIPIPFAIYAFVKRKTLNRKMRFVVLPTVELVYINIIIIIPIIYISTTNTIGNNKSVILYTLFVIFVFPIIILGVLFVINHRINYSINDDEYDKCLEQILQCGTFIGFTIHIISLVIANIYEYLNSRVHGIDNLETHEWNQQTILTHNQNPIVLIRCTTHNGNYEVTDRFLAQNDNSTNNTSETIFNDNIVESVNNVDENSETSAALSLMT